MIVTGCFKADPDRQAMLPQNPDQPHEVIGAVGDRQAPTACLARGGNQHLVPVFGNVDAYQAQQARACIYGHFREYNMNELSVDRTA